MGLRNWLGEKWAAATERDAVSARIIPAWKAAQPLMATDDLSAMAEEGYRRNIIVSACIWCITSSACEPKLVVKRRKADGSMELATGADSDALRRLLSHPNPEQSTFTFLERLFTYQQITGNWFLRKIRSTSGDVIYLWPENPEHVKIRPNANGWVDGYEVNKRSFPAADVLHDPLHPDPRNDFWGMSPIAVVARFLDLDNQATDYLRAFFLNNATPAGILNLKAKTLKSDRDRLKEVWKQDHTGLQGFHSITVLDTDATYQDVGSSPDKLRLSAIFDETESRICAAFGVPAIVVGAAIGLNRSTYANYAEARKSFWQDTLSPLYRRAAERLTMGLAPEFGEDLVIEFDLSDVQALQENQESRRKLAFDGWKEGVFTLNQTLEMLGQPSVEGEDGEARKTAPAAAPGGFGGLLRRTSGGEHHSRKITPAEKKAAAAFKRVATAHFEAQAAALLEHLK